MPRAPWNQPRTMSRTCVRTCLKTCRSPNALSKWTLMCRPWIMPWTHSNQALTICRKHWIIWERLIDESHPHHFRDNWLSHADFMCSRGLAGLLGAADVGEKEIGYH